MTSRKAGFDLPAIATLRRWQAGKSNPYRSTPKVRYVHESYMLNQNLTNTNTTFH